MSVRVGIQFRARLHVRVSVIGCVTTVTTVLIFTATLISCSPTAPYFSWFKNTSIILLLNKDDLFHEKIRKKVGDGVWECLALARHRHLAPYPRICVTNRRGGFLTITVRSVVMV